jgi:hypothetical protein
LLTPRYVDWEAHVREFRRLVGEFVSGIEQAERLDTAVNG